MGGETDLAGVGDVVDNPTGQSDDMTVYPAASEQPIEYTEVPPTPVENGHGEAAPEANPQDDNPAGDDVSAEMHSCIGLEVKRSCQRHFRSTVREQWQ